MKPFIVKIAILIGIITGCTTARAQHQQAVTTNVDGNKVYMQLGLPALQADLDSLFARSEAQSSSLSSLTWSDVLNNQANPGMHVDFYGYNALGLGQVTTTGTFLGDSLVLNKDATIAGRLSVSGVARLSDSLRVDGMVEFSDSLRVVKAVSVGQRLYVTGVTSLGDSLHVVGNVSLAAMLQVAGAATFGSTLQVAGEATFSDTLRLQSAALLQDSLNVGGNTHLQGDLRVDGDVNFQGALGVAGATTLSSSLDVLGGTSLADYLNVTGATTLSGDLMVNGETTLKDTLHVDAPALFGDSVHVAGNMGISGVLEVTSLVINGVTIPAIDDTDALPEGTSNLYYTDARARAALSGGTGVSINSGVVSIGQEVATTSDVTFDQLSVDSIAATGALSLTGRATLGDSLVVGSGARVAGTLWADSLVAGGLAIAGGVQIQDGNQSAGRVLTSDANGNATWQDAVSPYTAGTGVDVTNNVISIGQAVSTTSDVTFADVTADSLITAGLRITDGNEAAGKVLTSDANGKATWQDAVSPYTAGTGVDVTNNVISIGQDVATTADVTFDDVTVDSLAMTSALTVGGTATFSDSLFASKAVVLSDSLIVNGGARLTGTLLADSISTPGLAIGSAFKYTDGSQGANKILQSNADGEATWVSMPATNPNNPSVAIMGTLASAPSMASNAGYYNTGSYIDLPPGDWNVHANSIINSLAVTGYPGAAIWVRSYFSDDPVNFTPATTLAGGIIGGAQVYPAAFGLATGSVVIRNSGTSTRRYYWIAGNTEIVSNNPAATLYNFGGNQWGENSLIAYAVEEADNSSAPAPSTITESGDIVISEPVTMRGINNPITKPTNMLMDEISLTDDGTGFCTVDMEYSFTDNTGAAGAVSEYRVFTLPAGYEFDLNFHSTSTAATFVTGANGWTYEGMRAALPNGETGWVTSMSGDWSRLVVVPYSATEFRLAIADAGGVIQWTYVGDNFAMTDPHALKVNFRFKSTKAEGGLARVNISGGTGVTVNTDNEISIGQDVATTADVTFANVAASGLQVTDGSEGAGKVLVSDANGNASWEDRGSGGPKYAQFRGGAQQSFNPATPGGLLNFPITQINLGGFGLTNDNQITLPAGRIYRVDLNLGWVAISGSGGWCRFMMYDRDTGLSISPTAQMDAGSTNFSSSGVVTTFVDATAGDVTFEVRHVAGGGGVASLNEPGSNTQVTLSIQTVD